MRILATEECNEEEGEKRRRRERQRWVAGGDATKAD